VTPAAEQEIDNIINAGQVRPTLSGPLKPVLLLSSLSLVLLWMCFTPLQIAPAAWVVLAPFCVIIRTTALSRRQYLAITLCGGIWGIATLQWMRLGDPTMYPALAAMGFYISLYFPVFIGMSRRLIHTGIPLWLVVPVVWTALDFLRAWLMTGFSWYFLGHSQYRWIELIQIADVTGVYGITFLMAMSSAVLSEFIPESVFAKPDFDTPRSMSSRQRFISAATCTLLVTAAVIYGWQRQQSTDVTDGPVIALVQGYFPPEEKQDQDRRPQIVRVHDLLTRRAAELQPDLIVWPETMWPTISWIEAPDMTDTQVVQAITAKHFAPPDQSERLLDYFRSLKTKESLINRSQEFGTPIMFGLQTLEATSDGIRNYNSAALVRPDLGYIGRYDKMHCVIFGEYTPLKSTFPFLGQFRPPGMPELDAGTTPQTFESAGVRYAPAICFEDTVPRVVRRLLTSESDPANRPDVLVNMTNDGWFRGSSELDQHLITSLFRCVETRRPMVRAVNGGVSALIDSSGRIRDPETFLLMTSSAGLDGEFKQVDSMINPQTGRWYRECSGVLTGQLPLDGRNTIYLQYGDWFAMLCSALVIALFIRSFVKRRCKPSMDITV
jgi:apolipoprotein N-acyltransferase